MPYSLLARLGRLVSAALSGREGFASGESSGKDKGRNQAVGTCGTQILDGGGIKKSLLSAQAITCGRKLTRRAKTPPFRDDPVQEIITRCFSFEELTDTKPTTRFCHR